MRPISIFYILASIFLVTGVWYVQTAANCPVPVFYRLGEFDERFEISEAEAREVLLTAEMVWEKTTGKDLFVYDKDAEFAINFIYDERQQLASTEEEWRIRLDKQEEESRRIIEQLKTGAKAYEDLQAEYDFDRQDYEKQLNEYNSKVESINESGGASPEEYEELQEEQERLEESLEDLVELEQQLNDQAEDINELGDEGNQLVENYNAEVLQYNAIYGKREQFTQGDFRRERINVYKFSDKTELTKVIAHEFGHALGVGHVENEESIMYYLMQEQPDDIVLTNDDKFALAGVCGDAAGFSYELRRFIRTLL